MRARRRRAGVERMEFREFGILNVVCNVSGVFSDLEGVIFQCQ